MIRQVTEYECDACGKRQAGEMAEDVYGLTGKVGEHHRGGGVGSVEWFACSRKCVGTAIANAIDREYGFPPEEIETHEIAGKEDLTEALRACIAALRRIDNANGALTEGRGDLLYDNPDSLAKAMNAATTFGQRTYLDAIKVLKSFEEGRS